MRIVILTLIQFQYFQRERSEKKGEEASSRWRTSTKDSAFIGSARRQQAKERPDGWGSVLDANLFGLEAERKTNLVDQMSKDLEMNPRDISKILHHPYSSCYLDCLTAEKAYRFVL